MSRGNEGPGAAPPDRDIRIAAVVLLATGVGAGGLTILAGELGVARGAFGWKRIALLGAGGFVLASGALLLARPRVVLRLIDRWRIAPLERKIRVVAVLLLVVGLGASGVAMLAEELGIGRGAARGTFGWKRIALLTAGGATVAIGTLLWLRPRIVPRLIDRRQMAPVERVEPAASSRKLLIASGAAVIAAFIPRVITTGFQQNIDEPRWMGRSVNFSDAILGLDFSAASATTEGTATMPGVTTMWLGTIARGVWELGRTLGIIDETGSFADSVLGLHLAQLAVAAATSVLIGLFVVLAWRWAGPIAAIAAGTLLATEPFLVSQGSVLHTDELAGLFAATGTVALLIALGVAGGRTTRPRAMAALAGVLLAGAFLSKLSALLLAPGLAVIVAWVLVRAARHGRAQQNPWFAAVRPVGGLVGIGLAAAIATTLLAWPAIWADPVNQVSLMRASGGMAEEGHTSFFLGEKTETPGALFYLVAIPLRMTPWFVVGTMVVIAVALVRSTRPRLAALAVVAMPALVALSLASKQVSRYSLVVLPLIALAVGIGLAALWAGLRQGRPVRQEVRAVAGVAIVLLLVHSVWVAPWGVVYFNPLLGGSAAAERAIAIRGGAGQEGAGELIRKREAPACDVTIAVFRSPSPFAYPCGAVVDPDDDPDYYVITAYGRQRGPGVTEAMRHSGRTVGVVTIRGLDHAEVIDRRER